MTNGHVVLVGDSILDNDAYVGSSPGVTDQLRGVLDSEWIVSKVAVDGDCLRHVSAQANRIDRSATNAVLSIGGNDLLGNVELIRGVRNEGQVADRLSEYADVFAAAYGAAIRACGARGRTVACCTIYDAIPFTDPLMARIGPVAIGLANEVIVREAAAAKASVIRLDRLLRDADDYAAVSPIEPSSKGGQKIALAIKEHLETADAA